MRRPPQRMWYISGVYVGDLKFTDREHGRTAPSFFRKHCGGCGRRSRTGHGPGSADYAILRTRTEMKRLAEARRRTRALPDRS